MEQVKPIGVDGEGFDILKEAVLALLNEYPGLDGRAISFSGLTEDGGISMEPENGTLIFAETKNIIGDVKQKCQFPFYVVFRANASSEYLKMGVNEFLDTLGAWVCREPVTIGGTVHQLNKYPTLTGGRRITGVTRFYSYALEPNQNNTQDWVIPITVNYTHEFTMW